MKHVFKDSHGHRHYKFRYLMKKFSESYELMKIANASKRTSNILFYIGTGFEFSALLVQDITTKVIALGIGVGLDITALAVSSGYKRNLRKAVSKYNHELLKMQKTSMISLHSGFTQHGVDIINF